MCELCERARASPSYRAQLREWIARDGGRLAATREQAKGNQALANSFLSNIDFPPSIAIPLFEPRVPNPNPSNYFQNAFVDGVRLHSGWSHDCARSIGFFEDGGLLFITKAVARSVGAPEYLFYLYVIRFEKGEFRLSVDASGKALLEANVQKTGTNILSGAPASRLFSFSFQHFPTDTAILPKERAAAYYAQRAAAHAPGAAPHQPSISGFGGAPVSPAAPRPSLLSRTSGSSFEEYAITVPHLAPHPYLLQAYQELGFSSRIELQNSVSKFLKEHALG